MKDSNWIRTNQMLKTLKASPNCEHQFVHWIGGILRSTHWLIYDSEKELYGDSTNWFHYDWYTESEFIEMYAGHWWMQDD